MKSPTKWMLPAVLLLVVGTRGYSDEPEDTTKQILAEALATKRLVGRWHGRVVLNSKALEEAIKAGDEVISPEGVEKLRKELKEMGTVVWKFNRDGTASFKGTAQGKTVVGTGNWKVTEVEGNDITVKFTDDKRKTTHSYGFTRVGKDQLTSELSCKTVGVIYVQYDRLKKQNAPGGPKNKKP